MPLGTDAAVGRLHERGDGVLDARHLDLELREHLGAGREITHASPHLETPRRRGCRGLEQRRRIGEVTRPAVQGW